MSEMVLQSEDVMHPVCDDRGNTVLEGMESKAILRNRFHSASDARIRYLIEQRHKHSVQRLTM